MLPVHLVKMDGSIFDSDYRIKASDNSKTQAVIDYNNIQCTKTTISSYTSGTFLSYETYTGGRIPRCVKIPEFAYQSEWHSSDWNSSVNYLGSWIAGIESTGTQKNYDNGKVGYQASVGGPVVTFTDEGFTVTVGHVGSAAFSMNVWY